jgi:hypothetical protein
MMAIVVMVMAVVVPMIVVVIMFMIMALGMGVRGHAVGYENVAQVFRFAKCVLFGQGIWRLDIPLGLAY